MESTSDIADGRYVGERVAIVILNWNRAMLTEEAVRSCLALRDANLDIIVVDNASQTRDREQLAAVLATLGAVPLAESDTIPFPANPIDRRVFFVQNVGNFGFAGGNNVGLALALNAAADYGFLWVLNNDCVVDPSALCHLLAAARTKSEALVFFGDLIEGADEVRHMGAARFDWRRGTSRPAEAGRPVDYVVGASMLIRRDFIDRFGLMRECYFLYFEEIDWHARAGSEALHYVSDAIVWHSKGATIGSADPGGASLKSLFYLYRARVIFFRVNKPTAVLSCLASIVFEMVVYAKRGRWSGAWAIARGMVSGLACRATGYSWDRLAGAWSFVAAARARPLIP